MWDFPDVCICGLRQGLFRQLVSASVSVLRSLPVHQRVVTAVQADEVVQACTTCSDVFTSADVLRCADTAQHPQVLQSALDVDRRPVRVAGHEECHSNVLAVAILVDVLTNGWQHVVAIAVQIFVVHKRRLGVWWCVVMSGVSC